MMTMLINKIGLRMVIMVAMGDSAGGGVVRGAAKLIRRRS